jgi:predicted NAD-dependent protein-ADP-ribosyltransferase YbiA (DUF1768 family)
MDETIYHKFTQHASLMNELLATGNAELVEVSWTLVDIDYCMLTLSS